MKHYTHDDLVLYYYGEGRGRERIERHLDECSTCRNAFQAIRGTLSLIQPPTIPGRDERYGLEVWQRIRHQLAEREPVHWFRWMTVAAAAAVLVIVAFVAGRLMPRDAQPAPSPKPSAVQAARSDRAGERIRLAALGDHLERSERLLLDIANDRGSTDISDEQQWADDLVRTNRLYREAAVHAGDARSAAVLDELERQLLDIVHAPSKVTAQQLDDIRTRLEAAALLFKVRVLEDQVRERPDAPAAPRKTT